MLMDSQTKTPSTVPVVDFSAVCYTSARPPPHSPKAHKERPIEMENPSKSYSILKFQGMTWVVSGEVGAASWT